MSNETDDAILHRIFFGIIFALSVAELGFTIDTFIYLERQHKWWSFTEKARMGFLIFSCARTIFLSALYAVAHCQRVKNLMSTMHTVGRPRAKFLWIIKNTNGWSDLPRHLDHTLGRLWCSHSPDVGIRGV